MFRTMDDYSVRELRSPVRNIYSPSHELVSVCEPSLIPNHTGLIYIQKASSGHYPTQRRPTLCKHSISHEIG
jgi:hypothetical protein